MKSKWDRPAMRFVSAKYIPRQDILDVRFENGDAFLVALESILPRRIDSHDEARAANGAEVPTPDWPQIRIGETGDVLEVPAGETVLEIPWDRIRAVVDPEVRAHLADRAAERARKIGARIQALRPEARLTQADLGEKVGRTT